MVQKILSCACVSLLKYNVTSHVIVKISFLFLQRGCQRPNEISARYNNQCASTDAARSTSNFKVKGSFKEDCFYYSYHRFKHMPSNMVSFLFLVLFNIFLYFLIFFI